MLILYLLFILVLTLWGIKFSREDDYLSKEQCNSIKGIFILMICLTHSMQYIRASGYSFPGIDALTPIFTSYIGQLVVVMFLFYSGYGVALQIRNKGEQYVQQMPRHRILKTLLNFDVAVCAFILLALLLSQPLSISQVLLSFVAWDSVGNSNWYIFVILLCYSFTYIAGKIYYNHLGMVLLFLCLITMFMLSFVKESHWYDTILAYPAGYYHACYRNQIEKWLKEYYVFAFVVLLAVFVYLHDIFPYSYRGLPENITGITFALIVVMITMKVRIGNKWLQWCGINLFPLYIYQRLPMIALQAILGNDFLSNYPVIYLVTCLLITCLVAEYYKYWEINKLQYCKRNEVQLMKEKN